MQKFSWSLFLKAFLLLSWVSSNPSSNLRAGFSRDYPHPFEFQPDPSVMWEDVAIIPVHFSEIDWSCLTHAHRRTHAPRNTHTHTQIKGLFKQTSSTPETLWYTLTGAVTDLRHKGLRKPATPQVMALRRNRRQRRLYRDFPDFTNRVNTKKARLLDDSVDISIKICC